MKISFERLDKHGLVQNLCQILDSLSRRAAILNCPITQEATHVPDGELRKIARTLHVIDDYFDDVSSTRMFTCPVKTCARHFGRDDGLLRHIKQKDSLDHRALQISINTLHCDRCDMNFNQWKDVKNHVSKDHKGIYMPAYETSIKHNETKYGQSSLSFGSC